MKKAETVETRAIDTPSRILHAQAFQLGYDFIVFPPSHEIGMLQGFEIVSTLKIEPRLMQVLICLAEAEGKVISRAYLVEKIWDNYGGAEDALMQTVSKLRKFLQDDAKQQKVIQTIPKKGYKLLLPVRVLDEKMVGQLSKAGDGKVPGRKVGVLTGFIERLTQPKFFLAFLFLSVVVFFILSILSYMLFWIAVM